MQRFTSYYKTKNPRQKFKYLENGKSFWGETKSIFRHFYRAFSCQKLSQTWECIFNFYKKKIEENGVKFDVISHVTQDLRDMLCGFNKNTESLKNVFIFMLEYPRI